MRTLAAAVLFFEAVVVVLLVPVAVTLGDVDARGAIALGVIACAGCILTAGLLRHAWAYRVGWALQAALVLSGFVVPAMFLLGGLFAALWGTALYVGRRGDAVRAQRYAAAGVPDPKAPPGTAASSPSP
jgi:hypothetical protein